MTQRCAISKNPFLHLLIRFLPNRTKRLTFLASLAAIAKKTKEPDQAMIHKLNTLLGLSSTGDDALKLPIHVSGLIWTNQALVTQELDQLTAAKSTEQQNQELIERILDAIPEWFLYDDKDSVAKDILALFTREKQMASVNLAL